MLSRKYVVDLLNELLGANIDASVDDPFVDSVVAFASRIVADEREECAKLAPPKIALLIRKRGEKL